MPVEPEAFFLPADGGRLGQRFCIFHPAQGKEWRGSVLYTHPFAEEMNKSRRMAALQSRALAQAGYAVLQIDLLGCGDSSGDFGDATWQDWVSDVVQGCHWLQDRSQSSKRNPGQTLGPAADSHIASPLWLWGLRAGCLLAVEAASQLDEQCNFLFWQPPAAGKPLLQQFLRLKVAGDMLGGQAKGTTERLHQQLAAGNAVEIAGYALSPALAHGMEQAVLAPPEGLRRSASPVRLEWFEVSAREDAALSPVAQKTVTKWEQGGFAVQTHIVQGPSFWQTTEIEDAPALIAATMAAVALPRNNQVVTA